MSVAVRLQQVGLFRGVHETIRSLPLPAVFSPSGSENLWIDALGRAVEVFGYHAISEPLVDPLGLPGIVRRIFPYRRPDSVATELLAHAMTPSGAMSTYRSLDRGLTWTLLNSSPPVSTDVRTAVPDGLQFGDIFYLTRSGRNPQQYDGTTLQTIVSAIGRSPTPTIQTTGPDGPLVGQYRYRLVSKLTDGTRRRGSDASGVSGVLEGETVTLSWTADADLDVVGYEVYRTTGTGTLFYFADAVEGRTTTSYVDEVSDLTILEQASLQDSGDPPPGEVRYLAAHRQRVWWGGTTEFPRRWWYSDPGKPASVDLFNSFLDFDDESTLGDQTVGAVGEYEAMLVVFLERSIWTVSGTGQLAGPIVDWNRVRSNAQTGAVSRPAIVKVPAGARWTDESGQLQTLARSMLAYVTPVADIRLFGGESDTIISFPVAQTLGRLTYTARHRVQAAVDQVREQVIWWIPVDGGLHPTTAVCWNYRYGVWYVWTDQPFSGAVVLDSGTTRQLILTGGSPPDSRVYRYFEGHDFDGAPIPSQWMSKPLYGQNDGGQPLLTDTKRYRFLDVLFTEGSRAVLDLEWAAGQATDRFNADGLGNTAQLRETTLLRTADGDVICARGPTPTPATVTGVTAATLPATTSDTLVIPDVAVVDGEVLVVLISHIVENVSSVTWGSDPLSQVVGAALQGNTIVVLEGAAGTADVTITLAGTPTTDVRARAVTVSAEPSGPVVESGVNVLAGVTAIDVALTALDGGVLLDTVNVFAADDTLAPAPGQMALEPTVALTGANPSRTGASQSPAVTPSTATGWTWTDAASAGLAAISLAPTIDRVPIACVEALGQQQVALKSATRGRYVHDTALRLRIHKHSTTGPWALEGFTLGYQVLPGLKRRYKRDQPRTPQPPVGPSPGSLFLGFFTT